MNAVLAFPQAQALLGADAVARARASPAIRHFEGPGANKPWHYLCRQPQREAYFEQRRMTPWPRVRLKGRTPRNLLRRLTA